MRRALPALAVSAAGLAWLLHAQAAIDENVAADSSALGDSGLPSPTEPAAPTGRTSTTTVTTLTTTTTRSLQPGATPSTAPPASTPATSSSGSGSTTTKGTTVSTRFGPVQVEAVITDGRLTDVRALQAPSGARRSKQISDSSLPILRQEAITGQSADVDTVSGATYTSDAYRLSLQAALDQAGFN